MTVGIGFSPSIPMGASSFKLRQGRLTGHWEQVSGYRLDENHQNLLKLAPFYNALEQGGIP
jgi:hypothetical protein